MLHVSEPAPLLREASLGKQFPEELEKIVQKLLRKGPSERYQNFDDVANDLTAVYASGVVPTQTHSEVKVARESKKVTLTVKRLSLYLVLAMAVSSAVTTGVIQTSKLFGSKKVRAPKAAPQAPKDTVIADPTVNGPSVGLGALGEVEETIDPEYAAQKAFKNVGKMAAETVTSGQHRGMRKFEFPTLSLGTIIYGLNRHPALSTQYFPAGVPLTICVGGGDPAAFNHPEILDKLNVNDFAELRVAPPSSTVVEGEPVVQVEKEAAHLAIILSTFAKSESLNTVQIEQLAVNRKALAALDKVRELRALDLFLLPAIDLGSEKHPFFKRLSILSLTKPSHPELILRQIVGSNKLAKLGLRGCTLSPDFISGLRKCPKLDYLAIESDMYSDHWTNDLSQLHALRILYLNELTINKQQVQKILDTCPQVEKLILGGYTAESLIGQFKTDPRVVFRPPTPNNRRTFDATFE